MIFGDRYEVIRPVAKGGMAGVFLARDKRLGRSVAVMIIQDEHVTDPVFRKRFEKQVQAASGLTHPNMIRVYDYGIEDDVPYIITEFVRAKTLGQLLRDGRPPVDRAVHIVAEAAGALQNAHDHGLVHGHFTSSAVMVNSDGVVKVAGFGTGQDVADATQLTAIGTVSGTQAAFTPEQAKGMPAEARSDVYALGTILFELMYGRPPFEGGSAWSIAYKHVNEPLVFPDTDPHVPGEIQAIVAKAMAKLPEDRYDSVGAMRADLDAWLART